MTISNLRRNQQPFADACACVLTSLCAFVSFAAPSLDAGVGKPGGYQGLGAQSVSKEVLEKYAPPPLPSEVTRRIQAMLDIRGPGGGFITPDGKRLFFTWAVTGTPQVWRVDGPQRFPVQTTGGEDLTSVVGMSPDGSYIAIQRDRNGEENPGLYIQSVEGGALIEVQHKAKVQTQFQFISRDSQFVYFTANDLKPDSYALYRWNKATKTSELMLSEPGIWGVFDDADDGRVLLNKALGSAQNEVYEWSPVSKQLKPIIGQSEKEEFNAAFGAGDEILIATPKLSEFNRLYVLKAGALSPISPEIPHEVEGFTIDNKRRTILYTVNEAGFAKTYGLDAKTHKPLTLPKLPPGDSVRSSGFSSNSRFSTFRVETAKAPAVSYVYDWEKKSLTQWQTPSSPEVDTTQFAAAKLEYYPARDGTKIPMLVRRPKSCSEPCPVVVSFHGGPEGQALPGFSPSAQLFVDAGFVFVEPNVRGSSGFGKTWYHADDGAKRLSVVTDIEDAATFIRKNWAVNGRTPKVGIVGGSYGGYSALVGMTLFAGAYDAGVSIVGIANLLTFLNNTAPYRRILRTSEYGDPEKDKEALTQLSPMTYVNKLKAPLMVIQGATDPRVPVGEALQIHDTLAAKGIESPLIIFADEGHGARKRGNQVSQLGHSLRFFEEHLLGKKSR
jgi:protease II